MQLRRRWIENSHNVLKVRFANSKHWISRWLLWSQCQEGILQKVPMHWSKCPIKMVIGKWCILQFSTFKTASWKIWIVTKHRYFACNELYRIQNTFSAFISRRCAIFLAKKKTTTVVFVVATFQMFSQGKHCCIPHQNSTSQFCKAKYLVFACQPP